VVISMILAMLIVIVGGEQNPCPVVEVENTVQLSCTGCDGNFIPQYSVNCVDGSITTVVGA